MPGKQQGDRDMGKKLALLMVMVIAAGATVQAQGLDVIEGRQAGQGLFAGTFANIRNVVAAKGDLKPLEGQARYMARWIKQFPALFPKGSEQGHDTKALPAVWSDAAGFQKAANDMADA